MDPWPPQDNRLRTAHLRSTGPSPPIRPREPAPPPTAPGDSVSPNATHFSFSFHPSSSSEILPPPETDSALRCGVGVSAPASVRRHSRRHVAGTGPCKSELFALIPLILRVSPFPPLSALAANPSACTESPCAGWRREEPSKADAKRTDLPMNGVPGTQYPQSVPRKDSIR